MAHFVNHKGKRYGTLLVLRCASYDKWGHAMWLLKCDCGRRLEIRSEQVGKFESCFFCSGHVNGASSHKLEYNSYSAMKARCLDPENVCFKSYGGRGIRICDRWLGPAGFITFLKDMGKRPEGKTLDRRNPQGDYSPENCRWASSRTQQANKRCNYTEAELKVMQEEADKMRRDVERYQACEEEERRLYIEINGDDIGFVH